MGLSMVCLATGGILVALYCLFTGLFGHFVLIGVPSGVVGYYGLRNLFPGGIGSRRLLI